MTNEYNDVNQEVEGQQEEAKVYDMAFFLPSNEAETKEERAIITERYLKNGEPVPFVFKAISTERIDELTSYYTSVEVKGKNKGQKKFDNERFAARVAVETTVYPNFKDKSFLEAHHTSDSITAAKKMLSVGGEYNNWIDKAFNVNGYGEGYEDIEEEAKN